MATVMTKAAEFFCPSLQVVELLLKKDADINVCDKLGRSPLTLAASEGHSSTVELLLSKGEGSSLLLLSQTST